MSKSYHGKFEQNRIARSKCSIQISLTGAEIVSRGLELWEGEIFPRGPAKFIGSRQETRWEGNHLPHAAASSKSGL